MLILKTLFTSLCNFVEPPRAALRGLCPNRSKVKKKLNAQHTYIKHSAEIECFFSKYSPNVQVHSAHSCQVRRRILLRGLGRRPQHALLYGILWEKSDQVIVWLNHKDLQLLVGKRTN